MSKLAHSDQEASIQYSPYYVVLSRSTRSLNVDLNSWYAAISFMLKVWQEWHDINIYDYENKSYLLIQY